MSVEGTVPSQWYLDMKRRAEAAEAQRDERLTEDESRTLAFKVTDLEAQRDTAIAILSDWRGSEMPDRVAILRLENLYGIGSASETTSDGESVAPPVNR